MVPGCTLCRREDQIYANDRPATLVTAPFVLH